MPETIKTGHENAWKNGLIILGTLPVVKCGVFDVWNYFRYLANAVNLHGAH